MSENYEDKNKLICIKTTNVCVTLWSVFFQWLYYDRKEEEEEEEEEETLLIYAAQGGPFRRKKLSVINGSPEQQRTKTTLNI